MSFLRNIFKTREFTVAPPPPAPKKPKIGIAFGGGGFKGGAHVGVLKVLDEYGIKPDMVAGTSIGAAVAALVASGYNWRMLETLLCQFDLDAMMKVRPKRSGLIPATGYTEMIHTCVKGKKIEEMDIPLRIVAVDLVSWKKVVFDKGETAPAVRASSAIPGVFTPVKMGDMLLADGYLLDVCPTQVLRDMGADIVLAISLFSPNYSTPQNMVEIINRAVDIATAANRRIEADWLLEPIPHYLNSLSSKIVAQCMELGERAARANIQTLLNLCDARGVKYLRAINN
jgi:NTE family protein